ncbi:MAG: carbon starvation CstA 5TM domain-containing protein, partial [Eubacteriales bacterium]|nr:carbon starvation CstA 5TM domain-containing protein [Eubacteriales bacterium]
VPLLLAGALLTQLDFNALWRYFSWSNQTLAMIALWIATAYLIKEGKYRLGSLLTALPAAFMTAVSITYILMAGEGFSLSAAIGYPVGAACAALSFAAYAYLAVKQNSKRRLKASA